MDCTTMEGRSDYLKPLVCLRDRKSRVWSNPQVYHSEEIAQRELQHAAKYGKGVDGNPPIFVDYPSDFFLVRVGFFDSLSGAVIASELEIICEMTDLISKEDA